MGKPLILITPRLESRERTLQEPEHVGPEAGITDAFARSVFAAGGIPLTMGITEDEATIEQYLSIADGIAIPGGHDVSPELWGVEGYGHPEFLCPRRDRFEIDIVQRAVKAGIPLFATCRGMQVMNVALGGTLNMDVPNFTPRPGTALWRHSGILNNPSHPVEVKAGSKLSEIVGGQEVIQVNSAHHCCVERLGEGLRLVGEATDGVPEAIESTGPGFALGVQWHPEYTWGSIGSDAALWRAFVKAAAAHAVDAAEDAADGAAAAGDAERSQFRLFSKKNAVSRTLGPLRKMLSVRNTAENRVDMPSCERSASGFVS
ncbi:MAG: gamma-glutamyl-gamma-aminobutyrate hydrolase family protein [Coriobacteriaceae bacterium]|nr:gamma-glutamyl-gamma-aminobutyrate hydrolase family protein [Coriobacteriaceae bacterium]